MGKTPCDQSYPTPTRTFAQVTGGFQSAEGQSTPLTIKLARKLPLGLGPEDEEPPDPMSMRSPNGHITPVPYLLSKTGYQSLLGRFTVRGQVLGPTATSAHFGTATNEWTFVLLRSQLVDPGLNLGTCALPRRLRIGRGPAIHQAAPASTVIAAAATNHAVRLDHPLPTPTGPTPVPSKMPAATIPSKGPAIIAVLLIACPSHSRR